MGIQRKNLKTAALCLALVTMLLFPLPSVLAGNAAVSPEYSQTVGSLRTAYIACDKAYLTLGQPAVWKIVLYGGMESLACRFSLFFQAMEDTGDYFEGIGEQGYSVLDTYEFTPVKAGLYYLEALVRDGTGKTIALTCEPLLAASAGDCNERGTVIGTVKAVAARCIREASDSPFGRALWLHDWLIGHAEYDDSLVEYYPDGVLLRRTGTCQSFALAYQMLLREAGVESILVTGRADGELHAWNLVKLSGQWYHVDVTWDDQGGEDPGYAYFGLPDAVMGRDHDWSGGNLYPASGTDYGILERSGYMVFADPGGLEACMRSALNEKWESFRLFYAGTDPRFDLVAQLQAWWDVNQQDYSWSEYKWEASVWEGAVSVTYLAR